MNKLLLLLLLFISANQSLFAGLKVDLDYITYVSSVIYRGDDALNNSIVNLLDNDDGTFVLLNTYAHVKEFKVVFTHSQRVDRLVFVNGSTYGRIHTLKVRVLDGLVTNRVYTVGLQNKAGRQWLDLGNMWGRVFSFEVISWYNHPDNNRIALNGLEFKYEGKPIFLGEKEEMKQVYSKSYQKYVKELFSGLLSRTALVEYANIEKTLEHWKTLGIPVHRIYREYKADHVGLLMEISVESEFRGYIMVGIDAGKMYMEKKDGYHYENKLVDKMTIGEWSLDGSGHMWIRIGNGGWKDAGELYFSQSDWGEVRSIGAP